MRLDLVVQQHRHCHWCSSKSSMWPVLLRMQLNVSSNWELLLPWKHHQFSAAFFCLALACSIFCFTSAQTSCYWLLNFLQSALTPGALGSLIKSRACSGGFVYTMTMGVSLRHCEPHNCKQTVPKLMQDPAVLAYIHKSTITLQIR